MKVGGTRVKDVVAYINTTAGFGFELRIETVGGNIIEIAVSFVYPLSWSLFFI